jgi:drug/metabolite transporter (DMT)-like permease
LGLAAVVTASVLFSAKSVFFKICYRYGTPPITLQMLRGLFSLPFFLWPLYARFSGREAGRYAPIGFKDFGILVWLGFSGYYLASIFDMVGLQYITAGTERLILYVYPSLVVIFSALIFRKRIPKLLFAPLALSYAGIALSFGGEATLGGGGRAWMGGGLVFLSAVFYALFLVWQGRLLPRFGTQFFAAACMAASFIFVIGHFLLTQPLASLAQPTPVLWIAAFTAVFCNVVPVYLYGYGVRLVGAGRSAVASSVGPVSTLVLAGTLLGEHAGVAQILGLGLVVAGTFKLAGGDKPAPVQPGTSRGGTPSPSAPATRGEGESAPAWSPSPAPAKEGAPPAGLSDPAELAAAFLASEAKGRGSGGTARGRSAIRKA